MGRLFEKLRIPALVDKGGGWSYNNVCRINRNAVYLRGITIEPRQKRNGDLP